MEDEDIFIQGENPLDDDEKDAGDIPVRLLEDYVIYDMNSLEAVPLASLLNTSRSKCPFSASGLVKPWIEEDSDDSDDSEDTDSEDDRGRISVEPQWDRFSLSEIREFAVHSPGNSKGKLDEYVARYIFPSHHDEAIFR